MVAEAIPYPDAGALHRAADLLAAAEYPVLVVGLQCRCATEWLRALAESVPAPVLTTRKAKGVFRDSHPLALGLFPGGDIERAVLARADLLVMAGVDPEELVGAPPLSPAPVAYLGETRLSEHAPPPLVQVIGEIGSILEELAPRLRGRTQANWDVALIDRLKRGQI